MQGLSARINQELSRLSRSISTSECHKTTPIITISPNPLSSLEPIILFSEVIMMPRSSWRHQAPPSCQQAWFTLRHSFLVNSRATRSNDEPRLSKLYHCLQAALVRSIILYRALEHSVRQLRSSNCQGVSHPEYSQPTASTPVAAPYTRPPLYLPNSRQLCLRQLYVHYVS